MHTKDRGDQTEAVVALTLIKAGYAVSVPFGENNRYDLIVDDGAALRRIQCKTGRLYAGSVEFKTESSVDRKDYRGQIEAFGVYCPALDKVYLVPVGDVGTAQASLRVGPTQNNQKQGIRWAEAYEVASVAQSAQQDTCTVPFGGSNPSAGSKSDKCSTHPCPCGHPERHCAGCSGASPMSKPDSNTSDEGSTPSAPAMQDLLKRDHLPEGSY